MTTTPRPNFRPLLTALAGLAMAAGLAACSGPTPSAFGGQPAPAQPPAAAAQPPTNAAQSPDAAAQGAPGPASADAGQPKEDTAGPKPEMPPPGAGAARPDATAAQPGSDPAPPDPEEAAAQPAPPPELAPLLQAAADPTLAGAQATALEYVNGVGAVMMGGDSPVLAVLTHPDCAPCTKVPALKGTALYSESTWVAPLGHYELHLPDELQPMHFQRVLFTVDPVGDLVDLPDGTRALQLTGPGLEFTLGMWHGPDHWRVAHLEIAAVEGAVRVY